METHLAFGYREEGTGTVTHLSYCNVLYHMNFVYCKSTKNTCTHASNY
jgi:hypothetical protein